MASVKHDNLEPYDMIQGKCYAFTYNPPDPKLKRDNGTVTIASIYASLSRALNGCYYVDYYMFIEASKTGKLHLHGYIRVNDMYLWCVSGLRQLCLAGATCIREIDCPHIWYKYCTKSTHMFMGKDVCQPYVKQNMKLSEVKPPDYNEWYGNTTYKCKCKESHLEVERNVDIE